MRSIWITAAETIGVRVPRDADAAAVFHGICHTLIEGSTKPWVACSTDWREIAVRRVQHVLAGRHGLRDVLGPGDPAWTGDALADRTDRSVRGALVGLRRADREPWSPALHDALAATARLVGIATPPLHPTGFPLGGTTGSCASCAWRGVSGERVVCQQAEGVVVDEWPACERFEPVLDCQDCGACCREAFHMVAVESGDPAIQRLPLLVVADGDRFELRRDGDRCAALSGGSGQRYACTAYDDRPRTCRDFTSGTSSCLLARQRVGMSR
jgi:hypothetical protein